jgi:hypothetical protein
LALDQFIPRVQTTGSDIFTLELVTDLHRAVMRGDATYQDIPGEFRRVVVWIGGRGDIAYSAYNPAPPDEIAKSLTQTMAYMRGTRPEIVNQTLLTRMAITHGAEWALSILPHYPIVTVKRLAEHLGVSYTAAGTATDQLGSAGILIEQTGYERNRIFVAKEALSIVNRPFGADPILPDI